MKPVFIHIPKTAGTSIRSALKITFKNKETNNTHIPWSAARMKKHYRSQGENVFLFSCVRNPYDRAVSIHSHFSKKMVRANRLNYVFQELCMRLPLNDFWSTVNVEALRPHIPHLRTQHSFLKGADMDKVMRFENLQDDWKKVSAILGRSTLQLPTKMKGAKTKPKLSYSSVHRINSLFEEDFHHYGYNMITYS